MSRIMLLLQEFKIRFLYEYLLVIVTSIWYNSDGCNFPSRCSFSLTFVFATSILFISMSSNPSGSGERRKQLSRSAKKTKQPIKGGVRIPAFTRRSIGRMTVGVRPKAAKKREDSIGSGRRSNYGDVYDPTRVVAPVRNLVCPMLEQAWQVNNSNTMAFIFDVICPVREFKRGVEFDENSRHPYADYNSDSDNNSDVTQTDADTKTQPYNPISHQSVCQSDLRLNDCSFDSLPAGNTGGRTLPSKHLPFFDGLRMKRGRSGSE